MLDNIPRDKEVLFVAPYTPEDIEEAQLSGGGEDLMIRAFQNAVMRDPDFHNYLTNVAKIGGELGLTTYMPADDVIILDGERKAMEAAMDKLDETYYCHFNTTADFLSATEDPDFQTHLDIPPQKRLLN